MDREGLKSVPGTTHHGAYKTPGGKMVVVDFRLDGDVLRDVELSGDFFLYPDEALGAMTAALEGTSTDLSQSELAARVAVAMPPRTEFLGSSPEGVAIAVRRALRPEAENDGA